MFKILVRKLRRNVRCEEVRLQEYESSPEPRRQLAPHFHVYNRRVDQSNRDQT
jgi:hypothetical protein